MRRLAGMVAIGGLLAGTALVAPGRARPAEPQWVAAWGAAQLPVDGIDPAPTPALSDATLRQIVHVSLPGTKLRVRLSNAFGPKPLTIDTAAVARPAADDLSHVSDSKRLTFGGRTSVTIPAGAEAYSDAVAMPLAAGAALAISLHVPVLAELRTGHPGARSNSYVVAGAHVADTLLPGAIKTAHWYAISDVEIDAPRAQAVVAVGDSITDGYGVAPDTQRRWTDRLVERLQGDAATRGIAVVNTGIGGNRVLKDGLGPNLLARFERDVLARRGTRIAIVLEGVNDIGMLAREGPDTPEAHAALVGDVTAAFRDMGKRAHAKGIRLIGGTIMPFVGNDYYRGSARHEADRQAINAFIRSAGTFDAVIDFDAVMRDPAHPERLSPALDVGDHLHPSPDGYTAMANAVPLDLLRNAATGAADLRPAIALTFDDLPAHSVLPKDTTRLAIVRDLVAALKAHGAPAFGFVNGGFGTDDPQSPAVLDAWRAAFPLGNHTYSHLNLAENTAEKFESEVTRGEAAIAGRMGAADWHWFRYPFLSEGDTAEKRDAVRRFLAAQHYKVAAVTMSFGDYAWNEPYARCVAKGDTGAIAALETSYLAAARVEALAERALSQRVAGRDIPYVLLMHAGAFDARMLPRLLALYETLGFRFVSLPEAERDPFYAGATDLTRPGPSPTLGGAASAAGTYTAPAPLPQPDPNACR